jgi:hypothetical protein
MHNFFDLIKDMKDFFSDKGWMVYEKYLDPTLGWDWFSSHVDRPS